MDLEVLGIKAIRFKKAATDAGIMEVPGTTSGDKAKLLAEKLREVITQDIAVVSRSEICADLRISGLDDLVKKTEVVEAVARVGESLSASVEVGVFKFRNIDGFA